MLCRGTTMAAVLISGTIDFNSSYCTAHSCPAWPTLVASLLSSGRGHLVECYRGRVRYMGWQIFFMVTCKHMNDSLSKCNKC